MPAHYEHRKFTEADADALLAKHAPYWPEHLADGKVVDRVLDAVAVAAHYMRTRNQYTRSAQRRADLQAA